MSEQTGPIAVIEDEFTLKTGLKDLLEKEGFKAESLKLSADILKRLVALNPSIIITDLDEKNPADPFKVVAAIKKTEKLKESELFVYTESIDVKKEVGLRKLKIVSYFTKSENPQHLVSGIKNHFSWEEMSREYDPFAEMEEREESTLSIEDVAPLEEGPAPPVAAAPAQPDNSKKSDEFQEMPQEVHEGIEKKLDGTGEGSAPPVAAAPAQPDNSKKSDEFQEMLQEFHEGIEKKLDGTGEGSVPPVAAAPAQPDNDGKSDEFQEMLQEVHEGIEKKLDGTGEGSAPPVAAAPAQPDNYEKSGEFQEMLKEFHDGIEKKLEGTDEGPETYYNLGVSYFEMGLMDQALAQLEKSSKSPDWKLNSLTMIGTILRNQGEYEKAIRSFTICYKSATDNFAKLGFRYEIADTQAVQGKLAEAYKMFATVYKADKSFRDTRERLLQIKAALESKNKV